MSVIERWRAVWPEALAVWSPFAKLRDPLLCETADDAARAHLTQSFAAIRLTDHQVVVDMQAIARHKLEEFALEVLAHEVGHHIYCPADLADSARMLARIRKALPTKEDRAPLVSNLFSDLLINDRLQRTHQLRMADVYRALRSPDGDASGVWQLYMGIYEYLWGLPPRSLTAERLAPEMAVDASLGARLVRVYQRDWLKGAARFAALLFPYFVQEPSDPVAKVFSALNDATECGGPGAGIPDGLAEVGEDEDDVIHPGDDPLVGGNDAGEGVGAGRAATSAGRKEPAGVRPRSIVEYGELLRSLGVKVDDKELAIRYYRELASRFLVRFPDVPLAPTRQVDLEGHEVWDIGSPLEDVDWVQSVMASPRIVPGYTTRERVYGESMGKETGKSPPDIYIGIDCSGSMSDPRRQLSYPVLAGVVLACSALRAGARVMACLSGESRGRTVATDGFSRSEREVLELLTDYLGTGYSFGIHYLKPHLISRPRQNPTHVLVVSDSDIFSILNEVPSSGAGSGLQGWEVAKQAAAKCGAGATFALSLPPSCASRPEVQLMRQIGWNVHLVSSMDQIVLFAAALSRELYEAVRKEARR